MNDLNGFNAFRCENDLIDEVELKIELKIDSFWILKFFNFGVRMPSYDAMDNDGGRWSSRWRRFKSERLTAFCSTWAMIELDRPAVPPSGRGWKPKNFKNSKFLLIILYFIKKQKIIFYPTFMNWEKLYRKESKRIRRRSTGSSNV